MLITSYGHFSLFKTMKQPTDSCSAHCYISRYCNISRKISISIFPMLSQNLIHTCCFVFLDIIKLAWDKNTLDF